ncbi:MAG: translocation/assembly module TamB domain-containing protein [Treponema sp.]|nr:translocation/assembly module TamB domain-containing protein [Treponema sp.]
MLSVFVSKPVGKLISNEFSTLVKTAQETIYKKTTLHVSFTKLSPSIFSSVNLNGVTVSDDNGELVASIKKIKVSYSLWNLIKKRYEDVVSAIVIDGVDLKVEKLIPVIKNLAEKETDEKESQLDIDYLITYFKEKFDISIPLNVSVKNVSVTYDNDQISGSLDVKKIGLVYTQKRQQLEISLKSVLSAKIKKNDFKISSSMNLKGLLLNGLNDSSLTFTLSDLRAGNYFFNKFNLKLSFSDDTFHLDTIQNTFPLLVDCSYELGNRKLTALIKTENLSPKQVFSSSVKSNFASLLQNLNINSKINAVFEKGKLLWSFAADVLTPDGEGFNLYTIKADGDESYFNIQELSVNGDKYEASLNAGFDLKNLSLSGSAEVPKIFLPNGTLISTELYFDPLDKGFMVFIPQVFIDDKVFTAIQINVLPNNDSVDFTFEAYDYSHYENEEPSRIAIDGSYLFSSGFVQSSLSVNSFYLDSVLTTACKFLPYETSGKLLGYSSNLSTFMFSSDAYFTTDFSTFSYNVPYILVANTARDNQALMASINGNEMNMSLNDMNLVIGKNSFRSSFNLDFDPSSSDMFFQCDFSAFNIPYHFSGNYIQNALHISGDYNLAFDIFLDGLSNAENPSLYGSLIADSLPIPVLDHTFTATFDTSFSYNKEQGPEVQIVRFEMDEASGKVSANPHIFISGTGTRYGAQLNEISYSDLYSVLNGNADVFVNQDNGIFHSVGLNLNLLNQVTDESLSVLLNASNPEGLPFSLDAFRHNYYFDCEIAANNMSLNRWTYVNNENNAVTASVSFTGTLEHPYVGVNIENCSAYFNGYIAKLSGAAYLEDDLLTADSFSLNYNNILFALNKLDFSMSSFTGEMEGTLLTEVSRKDVDIPINIRLYDAVKEQGKFIPQSFALNLSCPNLGGSFFKKQTSFFIDARKYGDLFTFSSSSNMGLNGIYNSLTNEVNAELSSDGFLSLNASGLISESKLDVHLSKVFADLRNIFSYFNLDDAIHVYSGIVNGSINISGDLDNPEFTGACSVTKPEASLTKVIPDKISTEKTMITLYQNEITVVENTYKVKKSHNLIAGCKIFMNKWNLDHIEGKVYTKGKESVPVTLDMNVAVVEGYAQVDLDLVFEKKILDVTGNVFAENAEARFNINMINRTKTKPPVITNCNVDVVLGSHAKLSVDPILRCVFVPETSFNVVYDGEVENLMLNGKFLLKSGDVSYLNRSFYIKEGEIQFTNNEISGLMNPLVTIRAETRERDEKGDSIRIVFSAQNQYLQDLNPRFSSIPARSENEIMSLLGQIVIGDSTNVRDFIFTASDYAISSTIGRKFENTLRDLMNFDIFSVRTNVLKNALSIGTDTEKNSIKNYSFGNFFDNSTVYIGKYLGSSLYFDAMMHVSYNERVLSENFFRSGLLFQPELGFEMESPFGNIRWNIAPNLEALMKKQFVPDSSLTLSWKFNF